MQSRGTDNRHIFSRFDGDLGSFRRLVLEVGEMAGQQVELAAKAIAESDLLLARTIRDNFREVRDRDIDLLEANIRLLVVHQPVASDLRLMITLSRTAYDLERINQEAISLVEQVESRDRDKHPSENPELFDDVPRMAETTVQMLANAMRSIAENDIGLGIEVVKRQDKIERLSQAALRRLATYILQDPRHMPQLIEATVALKGLERVADHAVSIAKNQIFACSGKDVRHLNPLNLNSAFLGTE